MTATLPNFGATMASPIPSSPTLRKLTREEVATKYAPEPDPYWTAERLAAFFESLPKRTAPRAGCSCPRWLINEYAREVLGAKRISAGYAATLEALLHAFAGADVEGFEVRISQRMEQYGSQRSIRTIQEQMHKAGMLRKATRAQGCGFVGSVYVYGTKATWEGYDASMRIWECCETEYPDRVLAATGITDVDVPF